MSDKATASSTGKTGFDNNGQYSRTSILRYEKVFGDGYISTGGHETTLYLCEKLGDTLRQGAKVLDIGCGIGGAMFYLAEKYGCDVTGIDLAEEMVAIAHERAAEAGMSETVRFILGDVLKYPLGTYDIGWSRDALMHVPDKPGLFKRIYDLLNPGGRLVITDYARGEAPAAPEFDAYIQKTGYHVVSPTAYGKLLEGAGFTNVKVEDATARFIRILQEEMARLETHRTEFLKHFTAEDLNYILERWAMKVRFCQAGDMRWGIYVADKA